MIKVAITGGIGCGKSYVCRKFNNLGIPIYNTDIEAKACYDVLDVKLKVKALFGEDIYDEFDKINVKKISSIMFNDKSKLSELHLIILPVLRQKFEEWVNEQTSPYILCESAILFETNGESNFDFIITVYCPLELRIKRAVTRGTLSEVEIMDRISNQMSDDEKMAKSDIIIFNGGDMIDVLPQITSTDRLLRKITSKLNK
jgi:dephospho-CoA kinase